MLAKSLCAISSNSLSVVRSMFSSHSKYWHISLSIWLISLNWNILWEIINHDGGTDETEWLYGAATGTILNVNTILITFFIYLQDSFFSIPTFYIQLFFGFVFPPRCTLKHVYLPWADCLLCKFFPQGCTHYHWHYQWHPPEFQA